MTPSKGKELSAWTALVVLAVLLLAPCFHAAVAEAHPHGGLPSHEATDPCLLGATLQGPPSTDYGMTEVPVQSVTAASHGEQPSVRDLSVVLHRPPISLSPLYLLHRQYRL